MGTIRQLIIILLVMGVLPAFSAIKYVATTGNDVTGNGSYANPYASLYKASTVTTSGDTIYINSGSYTETSASALAVGVSILGAGRSTTTIVSNLSTYLITLNSSASPNQQGNQFISGITFDGNNTTGDQCISVNYRGGVSIYNCEFKNFLSGAVAFTGFANGENIKEEPATWVTNNKFYNNITTNNSKANKPPYTPWYYPNLWLTGQDGFLCYGNTMTENVRGADEGNCIGAHTSKRLKIYNNTFTRGSFVYGTWHFVCEIRYNYGEIEIYNNVSNAQFDVTYIWKQSTSYGLKFYGNTVGPETVSYLGDIGLELEADVETVYVYDNIFKNLMDAFYCSVTTVGTGYAWDNFSNVTFRNNLCYNIAPYTTYNYHGNGIFMTGINSTTWDNFYVYNNTFVCITASSSDVQSAIRLPDGGAVNNCHIKNNIFVGFRNAGLYCEPSGGKTVSVDSLFYFNNCVYGCGYSNDPRLTSITLTNYSYGDNIKVSPGLNALYRPTSSSPVVDAGIDVGLTYIGVAPDMGAYEYTPEPSKFVRWYGRLVKSDGRAVKY